MVWKFSTGWYLKVVRCDLIISKRKKLRCREKKVEDFKAPIEGYRFASPFSVSPKLWQQERSLEDRGPGWAQGLDNKSHWKPSPSWCRCPGTRRTCAQGSLPGSPQVCRISSAQQRSCPTAHHSTAEGMETRREEGPCPSHWAFAATVLCPQTAQLWGHLHLILTTNLFS